MLHTIFQQKKNRLCVVIVLYIVGGVLFQKYYRHESGWDLIPNREFWMALPGLVKDGCVYTYQGISALISRFRGNS